VKDAAGGIARRFECGTEAIRELLYGGLSRGSGGRGRRNWRQDELLLLDHIIDVGKETCHQGLNLRICIGLIGESLWNVKLVNIRWLKFLVTQHAGHDDSISK
jgi:hypothetical protein